MEGVGTVGKDRRYRWKWRNEKKGTNVGEKHGEANVAKRSG